MGLHFLVLLGWGVLIATQGTQILPGMGQHCLCVLRGCLVLQGCCPGHGGGMAAVVAPGAGKGAARSLGDFFL